MTEHTPDYYRITPDEDLVDWCGRRLDTAQWVSSVHARPLDLAWFNVLRYAVRIPFKGTTPAAHIQDINKAIATLKALRGLLARLPEDALL
jgi:hypothetical protein